jgi:hypothetical protein
MNELLEFAIRAHGGQERWMDLRSVRAKLSVTGALWESQGVSEALKGIDIEASLHEQKVITDLPSQQKRYIFQPDLIIVESQSGKTRTRFANPRMTFAWPSQTTRWEDVHVAYFNNSYAL